MNARWALLACVMAATLVVPAEAQVTATEARLYLADLRGIVGPGSVEPGVEPPEADLRLRLLVENAGSAPAEGLRLSVEVFERARFRSTLHRALDDGERLSLLDSTILDVRGGEALAPGDIAGLSIARPAAEMPWAAASTITGVYPVVLTLLQGTEELDRLATAVVHLAEPVAEPLQTSVVWPLNEAPWRLPGEDYPPDVDVSIRPGGRLDELLRVVEEVEEPRVLLAPAAHLLEDLEDRADGFTIVEDDGLRRDVGPDDVPAVRAAAFLERVRAVVAAAAFEPVAGSYADADITALVNAPAPLDDEASTVTSQGRRRLDEILQARPDPATFWVTTPLDRSALDVLVETGVEHLLLPSDQVTYPDDLANYPELPNPLRALTTPRGRRVTATVPDPYVDRVVRDPDLRHGPVAAGQRLLAETAVLWGERPGSAGRILAIQPPPDWELPGPTVEAFHRALETAPWLAFVEAGRQPTLTEQPPAPATLVADAPELSRTLTDALISVRDDLATLLEAVPGEVDEQLAGRPVTALERELLRAPSSWYRGGGRGLALVQDVAATVDRAFGEIDVPTGARITLTSESGTIPVTIQRKTGDPLEVRVTLESRASLRWTEGRDELVTFDEPGVRTLSFPVRVAAPGSFGVNVTVTDAAGDRVLATGTIPVRSTAISRPAIFGTGAVVLLLLLVGLWRRSRSRRPKLEVVTPGRS